MNLNEVLEIAAEKGNLEVVKFLVEEGVDVHTYDDCALCGAAEKGHLEVVKFLAWFDDKYPYSVELDELIQDLLKDDKEHVANWLIAHTLTHENCVRYSVFAVELSLPIFEAKYPENKMPHDAIKAAKVWLENPTKKNREAYYDAAWDAASAYANAVLAADAGCAGAARDDYAAAWAGARVAARFADAAAWADLAAGKETLTKIISHGLELLKKQETINGTY